MRIVRFVVFLAALAGCQAAPTNPAAPNGEPEPMGVATSPCGRFTLQLDHASWREDPGDRPRLTLRMRCVPLDENSMLGRDARVTDLMSEAGVQWAEKGLEGHASNVHHSDRFTIWNLKQYERADRVQRMRVVCSILHVKEWSSYDVSCESVDATAEYVCPPFEIGLFGNDDGWCSVSTAMARDFAALPHPARELARHVHSDMAARGLELRDADGKELMLSGGFGGGGQSVWRFGLPFPDGAPRYPVRGTLRVPKRFSVEVVAFEFVDVPLARPTE
ncbi:MAG: hypothetical protein AAGD14_01255 [Planctomycetota bacterium]